MIPASIYYRPQTKFAKVMLLHLSVILFRGSVCLSACWDTPPEQTPRGSRQPPRSRHSLTAQSRHTPQGADTPHHSACWEIRAISGRYASYWNAYLFNHIFFQILKCVSFFVVGLHCPRLIPTLVPIQIPTICRKASLELIPIVISM